MALQHLNRELLNERTYTIQQAGRKVDVSTHTLRYWEKALNGIVMPLRTQGGQRRYTGEHILILEEIKRLKRKGLTLHQIRTELTPGPDGQQTAPDPMAVNHLADHIAETVRSIIQRFFQANRKS